MHIIKILTVLFTSIMRKEPTLVHGLGGYQLDIVWLAFIFSVVITL